ncbi:hypothetical protein ACTWQL_16295 [Pseudalkalibacillus sp. R45]|uniref:hypothetical protein n=1 Tax=Pseudalkalibacillus sp. R45 TaxID=3457433 RepID=UPI003FCCAE4C
MAEKKIALTPDAFKIKENGEVVVNDAQLVDLIKKEIDEVSVGQQGIAPDLSIKP